MASLHASRQTPDTMYDPSYWAQVCPHLHISDASFQAKCGAKDRRGGIVGEANGEAVTNGTEAKDRMVEEGFAVLEPEQLRWSVDQAAVVRGIEQLRALGWPATAIIIFDEAWALGADAAAVMSEVVPQNGHVMDTLCFYVDPGVNAQGFSAHRDRQPEDWTHKGFPEDPLSTFWEDGTARYATIWMALTDATADNSCLHYIPLACDEGYFGCDDNGEGGEDKEGKEGGEGSSSSSSSTGVWLNPVQRLLQKESSNLQRIRPAPVRAGGVAMHTHRVIHWGSRGRPSYKGRPRIALSFAFSDPAFEPPNLLKTSEYPVLSQRVALMAGQVINYSSLSSTDRSGWLAVVASEAGHGDGKDDGEESAADEEKSGGASSSSSSSSSSAAVPSGKSIHGFLRMLHRAFRREASQFHSAYRSEITSKFLAVTTDGPGAGTGRGNSTAAAGVGVAGAGAKGGHTMGRGEGGNADDDDSDAVDEALEAMLQDEFASGKATYCDDFDTMNYQEGEDGEDGEEGGEGGEGEEESESEEEFDENGVYTGMELGGGQEGKQNSKRQKLSA